MKNEPLDSKPAETAEAAPTAPAEIRKKKTPAKRRAEAPAKRSGTKKAAIVRLLHRDGRTQRLLVPGRSSAKMGL